jgi:hypothetical protein
MRRIGRRGELKIDQVVGMRMEDKIRMRRKIELKRNIGRKNINILI